MPSGLSAPGFQGENGAVVNDFDGGELIISADDGAGGNDRGDSRQQDAEEAEFIECDHADDADDLPF